MPPQIKKIPLPFPASWTSSVLQLFLPLVSLRPFSGPPIPDISCQYQLHHHCFYACFRTSWTLYEDTVLCKAHKSTTTLEDACIWQCMPDTWTYMTGYANICSHFWKFATWRGLTICGGLPVLAKNRWFLGTTHPSSLFVADADLKNLWNENQIHFSWLQRKTHILNRIQHMLCMDTKY